MKAGNIHLIDNCGIFKIQTPSSMTNSQNVFLYVTTLVKVEQQIGRFGKFCGEYQLVWKVKEFGKCFDDAKNGVKPIVYSPTFDTHRNGYKIQLSLCPYGDGKGKR